MDTWLAHFLIALEGLSDEELKSKGILFSTKTNDYFYDSGSGKVVLIEEDDERAFFAYCCGEQKIDANWTTLKDRLFERGFISIIVEEGLLLGGGLKDLYSLSHYEKLESILENNVTQLILELTESCNLRCKYCIYHDEFKSNRNFGNEEMLLVTAIKAVEFAFAHSGKELSISFYGGEPLIKFNLMRNIIDYCNAKAKIYDKDIRYSFTTNLTLMNEEMAQYFASLGNCNILCSIDGPRDIHDSWRIYCDRRGSFDDCMRGYELITDAYREKGLEGISINGVFAPPYRTSSLEKIAEFYKNISFSINSSIDLTLPNEGSVDEDEEILSDLNLTIDSEGNAVFLNPITEWLKSQDMLRISSSINSINHNAVIQMLDIIHRRLCLDCSVSNMIPFNGCCVPGVRRLYVTVNGDFKVCERIGDSPSIGHVDRGFDIELIREKYVQDYANASKEDCSKCWANLLCGICYTSSYTDEGFNLDKKRHFCTSEREHVKECLMLYHEILENNPDELMKLNNLIRA